MYCGIEWEKSVKSDITADMTLYEFRGIAVTVCKNIIMGKQSNCGLWLCFLNDNQPVLSCSVLATKQTKPGVAFFPPKDLEEA